MAAVTAGYAVCSRRLSSSPVTSAMVFTGFGVLIGPLGLDLLDLEHDAGPVLTLVETALALVLFTDAMTVRRRDLRSGGFLPARLLGIGLPLTIGAGWLLAWPLLPGLTAWELALVGAVLAPTDAALGRTAITSPRVPALVRHGLNAESGLNDGMVLPFFVLFLAALPGTTASEEGVAGIFWRALVLSTALGLAVGWFGGRLLQSARARGWLTPVWGQVFVLAVAAGSYALAVVTEGSGFIAAWVAGFAFSAALRSSAAQEESHEDSREAKSADRPADFVENLAELLTALCFLVFGAVLLGPALEHLNWRIVAYALLSLTVVRMLPVALSLMGSRLRPPTVAYIGWFGPRGLASIVFGLLVVEEHVAGVELLGRVVAITVGLSILLHGMSAVALSHRYGAWHTAAAAGPVKLREDTPAPAGRRRPGPLDEPEQ
ncbi:sodium:proton antiporter [Streptomyces sp. A3M-1-3]|uniref:cation:proton antiporter n=1 Tax=Streptomyces sp. A3M-1-3 TaxID=2962044 RepID=UPI0020B6437B|nr:sodium:proton antiporter [Streptomyces sp. A3M-1-3]MCP3819266.1 sodium:proton antiporter [Streptomyces sp. A3M-1-3]